MHCYIKDGRTFVTRCVCPVLEAAYTPWSIYDEVSDFVISAEKEQLMKEGDILAADDYIGIVKQVQREDHTAKLKCEHIVKLFSRDLVYTEEETDSLEEYLQEAITREYIAQPDAMYRLPFVEVVVHTSTASAMRPDVESGVWNIKSFIAKLRRLHNIHTTFTYTRTRLVVTISHLVDTPKNLTLANPAVRLIEETYSNSTVGRITSLVTETGAVKDWYLLEDGTLTTQYTEQGRVDGKWLVLPITLLDGDTEAEIESQVRSEFAKNSYAHKVLFDVAEGAARYEFYDRLIIAKDKRLFYSYIAAIRKTLNSGRVEYLCGELRTTFTDKIQEVL